MSLKINRVVKNWKYAKKITIKDGEFNDNGFGRRFKKQTTVNYWKEAFAAFKLKPKTTNYLLDNFRGGNNYIGNHYQDGAQVPEHIDPAPEGFVHIRCNLMLKKPPVGGNPIINGEEIKVEENDLWICLVSLEPHSSTPIKGGERLIFSFGGIVPMKEVKKIYEI
jgi:hypothetical protein